MRVKRMTEIKTYEAFKNAIINCGLTTIEAEFPKAKQFPFVVYFRENVEPIHSDGIVIIEITKMAAELYTTKKDLQSERVFERWLTDNGIDFTKTDRIWVKEEKAFLNVYEFEMIFDG